MKWRNDMATEKDKVIKFVAKLIELTQDGKVVWSTIEPRRTLKSHPDYPVDLVYVTEYKEKRLGLYRQRADYVTLGSLLSGSFGTTGYSGFSGTSPQRNSRIGTILEMVDYSGNCLWTFPEVSGLQDLYDAVQYQVAGVKNYLDSVISDDKNDKNK